MSSDEEAYKKFIYVSENESSEGSAPKQLKTKLEQFDMIDRFIKQHNEKFLKKEECDHLWNNLSVDLNRIGPPVRSAPAWRRIWTLHKYNQKRKLSGPSSESSHKRTCDRPQTSESSQSIEYEQPIESRENAALETDSPAEQNISSTVERSNIQSSADLCAILQLVLQKLDTILEVLLDIKNAVAPSSS